MTTTDLSAKHDTSSAGTTTDELARPAEMFELNETTCASLLRTQQVGRLVTAGEEPHIVPVNYVVAEGAIVFSVEAGPRADRLVGRRAAFEIDVLDGRTRSGWSVIAHGRISKRFPQDPSDGGSSAPQPWAPGDRHCGLMMSVDTVTGRLVRGSVGASSPAAGYL